MSMRRYLLVLDMDLLAVDAELDLEPISYLAARREQEPCEVVVLSLVDTRSTHLPAMEMLLGARIAKFPVAPKPDHDVSAAAEHRMSLAIRHLTTVGCHASGLISDDDLTKAVHAEIRRHGYDGVILATGRQGGHRGSWLARALHLDPVHRLRWRLRQRLVVFPLGPDAPHPTPAW
jgi:hypothetical protein